RTLLPLSGGPVPLHMGGVDRDGVLVPLVRHHVDGGPVLRSREEVTRDQQAALVLSDEEVLTARLAEHDWVGRNLFACPFFCTPPAGRLALFRQVRRVLRPHTTRDRQSLREE